MTELVECTKANLETEDFHPLIAVAIFILDSALAVDSNKNRKTINHRQQCRSREEQPGKCRVPGESCNCLFREPIKPVRPYR